MLQRVRWRGIQEQGITFNNERIVAIFQRERIRLFAAILRPFTELREVQRYTLSLSQTNQMGTRWGEPFGGLWQATDSVTFGGVPGPERSALLDR